MSKAKKQKKRGRRRTAIQNSLDFAMAMTVVSYALRTFLPQLNQKVASHVCMFVAPVGCGHKKQRAK